MAAKFIPVWKELGSDQWPISTAKIMIPLKKSRLLLLEGAKVQRWKGDAVVGVAPVAGKDEAFHLLNLYLADLNLAAADQQTLLGALKGRVESSLDNGGQLFSVTGKTPGQTKMQVDNTLLNFVVTGSLDFDITFKFLRILGENNAMVDATIHKPSEVDGWIKQLNWILGSQANVWFVSTDRRTFDINRQFPAPFTADMIINQVKEFKDELDHSADVTVYLVGRYSATSAGTTFPDLSPKGDIAIVIDDKCTGIPVVKGDDPFILTLAHELVHFVLDKQGKKDKEHHLFDVDNVLLSKKTESTVLSASTLDMLYPPDKK